MSNGSHFEFDKRKNEVEYYFYCLKNMYGFFDQKQSLVLKAKLKGEDFDYSDFLIMLKSSSFLVLYNLIEASIRNLIQSIYDEVTINRLKYKEVCEELQKIWIDVYYDNLNSTSTNFEQHKSKAKEMIDFVINEKRVELSSDKIKLSGNLDMRQIKKVFKKHGMDIVDNDELNPAVGMLEVKSKRNLIAHGNISFIESARESSMEDLINYKTEIINFLIELEETVSQYISQQQYIYAP